MYELKRIAAFTVDKLEAGQQVILATIVKTEGSSYRKKWTQMAIADDLSYAGHLSGGCVEKEVLRQAQLVFNSGKTILFPYDGTYRLGCKGIIYILLELIDKAHFNAISQQINLCATQRLPFKQGINDWEKSNLKQTFFQFEDHEKQYYLSVQKTPIEATETRTIKPQKQLVIIGSEFDSDQLSHLAHQLGYQVKQVVGFNYTAKNFGYDVIVAEPEMLAQKVQFDKRTAILLMTHNYARDLHFIKVLLTEEVAYMGTLGPKQRKAEMIDYLFEHFADAPPAQLDKIADLKGPIGMNIPSKTPEEIAVAILAELVAVFNE